MRILQVTIYSDLKFGGPTHKIHALSCGLVERGHQVQLATFYPEQRAFDPYAATTEIQVHYLPWRGRGLWQFPLDLKPLRQAIQQADIVHCYGLYDLLVPAAAHLARKLKRPYVLEPLGMYTPRARSQRAKHLYHRLFTSWIARSAARIIATSPTEAEELSSLVRKDQLVLRRNGIDVTAFENLPDGAAFRAQHKIGDQERLILFMGRISPIKNLEALITAFKTAHLQEARLMLVGPSLEPDYATRVHNQIQSLGLANRVLLPGSLFNEEKLAALAAADLFVLPSQYESYGNAAAEAVAAGVPVLLTETCGIAPLIHQRAGLAVAATPEGLTRGLETMLNDPTRCARLTRSREEVKRELSWEEPLNITEQLYETIVRESR